MERTLTDEEIVKALDFCSSATCCGSDCPYFNKHGRNFCVEDNAFYKDMKRIVLEHAEQKAEIERLTEELEAKKKECREIADDYQEMGTFYYNETVKTAELQKQVDERENEIDRLEKVVHEQSEQYYNLEQRTAVEILQKGRYCMPSGLRDWICERYGVEVE
jgi:uncharacterized protein (DUF2164 family)